MAALSPAASPPPHNVPGDAHSDVPGDVRSDVRGVARGGSLNLAGAVVAAAANVLLILLVTRQVAPDRAGSLFAATSIFLIAATLARAGTTTGLVYWLARLRALGRGHEIGRCLRLALVPVAVIGLAVTGALLLAAEPLGRLVGGEHPDIAAGYLRSLAAFLTLAALSDALLSASRGVGVMRVTVVVDKLSRPLAQIGLTVAVLAAAAPGLLAVAWAAPYAGSAAVAALWLVYLLRRRVDPPVRSGDTGHGPLRAAEFWRYTAPRSAGMLVQLALQRLDIVLVAALSGPAAAAVYTAATRFVVAGQLGGHAIATAVQPRLAALLAVGERAAAERLYQLATGWLVLLAWPLYLGCIVFAGALIALFGGEYAAGAPAVAILAVAMLLATVCGMVDSMLNMAGKTVWTLVNSALALTTMVAVDLLLVPSLGITGAAIGWAAAIAVNNLVPLVQLWALLGLHPFGQETRRAAIAAAATVGAVPVLLAAAGAGTAVRAVAFGGAAVAFVGVVAVSRRTLALDQLAAALRRTRREPATHGQEIRTV